MQIHPHRPAPLIIAHRGASQQAPENTLAAFNTAWRQGADGVECDVHLTRDGHLVCCHDDTTLRTTGVNRRLADTSLRTLRTLDAGTWKGDRWQGERIPALQELLCTRPPQAVLFIEVKCGPAAVPVLLNLLAETATPMHAIYLISFDPTVIARWRQHVPQGRACLLLTASQHGLPAPHPSAPRLWQQVAASGATGGGLEYTDAINADTVAGGHAAHLELHVWTVNHADPIRHCIRIGVSSITTDRPTLARDVIREARTWRPPRGPGTRHTDHHP